MSIIRFKYEAKRWRGKEAARLMKTLIGATTAFLEENRSLNIIYIVVADHNFFLFYSYLSIQSLFDEVEKARSFTDNKYNTRPPTKHKSNIPEYRKVVTVPNFDCILPPIMAPSDCPSPPYIAFMSSSIVAFIPGGLILCAYMLPEDQNNANVSPLKASAGIA